MINAVQCITNIAMQSPSPHSIWHRRAYQLTSCEYGSSHLNSFAIKYLKFYTQKIIYFIHIFSFDNMQYQNFTRVANELSSQRVLRSVQILSFEIFLQHIISDCISTCSPRLPAGAVPEMSSHWCGTSAHSVSGWRCPAVGWSTARWSPARYAALCRWCSWRSSAGLCRYSYN